MKLPNKVFFTGVIGSKWSSISQEFEKVQGVNTSDQTDARTYEPGQYAGYAPGKWSTGPLHRSSYFGYGMEFEPVLDDAYINQAWTETGGCKIVKSHEWADMLEDITVKFPNDWIMLVYRPNEASHYWWCEHGGLNITYPNYSYYKDHPTAAFTIARQNDAMLKFAQRHDLRWGYFNERWVEEEFGQRIKINRPPQQWNDILVTMYKPCIN